MQETELIQSAQAGDREALVQLLREVETPLYRTAFYILGNEHDALDATQDALIKIYRSFHTYKHKAKFSTWAQRIVTNVCIDKCRQRKENLSIDEHDFILNDQSKNEVEEEMNRKLMSEDIKGAIKQLPEKHRSVVILRYIQELSYKEIADVVDLPINTVKSHLFRARQQLQELLQDVQKGGVSR